MTPSIHAMRLRHPRELIVLEGFPHAREIFAFNPWLPGGREESGRVVELNHGAWFGARTHVVKYGRAFGLEHQPHTLPELYLTTAELARDFGIRRWRKTVAVDVWASGPSRRWPFAHFQELATRLIADGWRVLEVGHHEGPKLEGAVDFRERLTFRESATVIAKASIYVGNDSGLLHVAAAVKTPHVGLFSVTPWNRVAYGETIALQGPNCGGWGKPPKACNNVCPRSVVPECLAKISVDVVLEAIKKQRSSPTSGPRT